MMRTPIDTLWDPTKILEYLPKKAKIQILIENLDPTFTSEMRTKGISNRPWPNDYNGIMNQRYKVWTPQGRIPDKFTVLEKPKEEQSLTFSDFLFNNFLKKKSENVRFCSTFGSLRTMNLSKILPCGVQTLYLWFMILL